VRWTFTKCVKPTKHKHTHTHHTHITQNTLFRVVCVKRTAAVKCACECVFAPRRRFFNGMTVGRRRQMNGSPRGFAPLMTSPVTRSRARQTLKRSHTRQRARAHGRVSTIIANSQVAVVVTISKVVVVVVVVVK